jgi:wyosine [tRNA(Phe)-imidazoG37] synthetase (radical SAM superfamily)
MVLPIKESIMYGPVNSRRLGKSMGINLMPYRKKYCDFDCLYCHYGKTIYHRLKPHDDDIFPAVDTVLQEVERSLESDTEYNYLTFSGNGEPTLHPQFARLAQECNRLARKIRPYAKVTLLTNSTTCLTDEFAGAFEFIDLPIMKLDAGNAELFRKINRPVEGINFEDIVDGLARLKDITIQALFLAGNPDNSTPEAVKDWFSCLVKIKPVDIQIYTLDRPYAKTTESGPVSITRVESSRMDEIVSAARTKYGFKISRY